MRSSRFQYLLGGLALLLLFSSPIPASAEFVLTRDALASVGGFVAGANSTVGMTGGQSVTGVRTANGTLVETVGFWVWDSLTVLDVPSARVEEAGPRLATVSPNPSSGHVHFQFSLPQAGHAALRIFDLSGRVVRTLEAGHSPAGARTTTWDGKLEQGRRTPAGLYFVRLDAGMAHVSRRFILIN